jgi:hypothetical protein
VTPPATFARTPRKDATMNRTTLARTIDACMVGLCYLVLTGCGVIWLAGLVLTVTH